MAGAFKERWGDEEGRRVAYMARIDGEMRREQKVRVAVAFEERWGDEEGRRVAYMGD